MIPIWGSRGTPYGEHVVRPYDAHRENENGGHVGIIWYSGGTPHVYHVIPIFENHVMWDAHMFTTCSPRELPYGLPRDPHVIPIWFTIWAYHMFTT